MKTKLNYLFVLIILLLVSNCKSQTDNSKQNLVNREPAVAGAFYSKNPEQLKSDLENLFSDAVDKVTNNKVLAIISPHAGYVYSGRVAASSFNQINRNKKYKTIFLIGSSHKTSFSGASIYSKGNYVTPLGEVKVNIELSEKLISENKFINYYRDAHWFEHSLEVQLPFLQYIMKEDFEIVPIIIADQTPGFSKKLAKVLKPYFNEDYLFIISSDFSHYPKYDDAVIVDNLTADAIISKSPARFVNTITANSQRGIDNLATSCCGWTSVLTLLYLIEDEPNINLRKVQYENSGDAERIGEKSRVVGYHSIVAFIVKNNKVEKSDFIISEKDKKVLLNIARNTIVEYVANKKIPDIDSQNFSEELKTNCGAFVTLHKSGKLRGCIGRFDAQEPLFSIIQQMAISAVTQDHRFQPVKSDEIKDLEIEISVLTPMKKINSIDEIELGKHGIYIIKGSNKGTFLPQVATETGWDLEQFLGHCARDKAGIGWEGWKDADIYIYEAKVFNESELE
ncbi:MAG: AmmeMemoRadiSam system protein B [Bacteroidales bacterium]|nr:AmmeMemoRadiSam system protein B [Bacteroidales bacterium]